MSLPSQRRRAPIISHDPCPGCIRESRKLRRDIAALADHDHPDTARKRIKEAVAEVAGIPQMAKG